MSTRIDVKECVSQFSSQETQCDDWIVARALEIVERRMLCGGQRLDNPQDVKHFLRLKLTDQRNETFAVLFLDSQLQFLAYDELFKGTVNQTSVYPRVVLFEAMRHNASAVIFAHNHPSGLVEPSEADKRMTSELKTILDAVDVRVLDHVVIGKGEPFSFAESGLL